MEGGSLLQGPAHPRCSHPLVPGGALARLGDLAASSSPLLASRLPVAPSSPRSRGSEPSLSPETPRLELIFCLPKPAILIAPQLRIRWLGRVAVEATLDWGVGWESQPVAGAGGSHQARVRNAGSRCWVRSAPDREGGWRQWMLQPSTLSILGASAESVLRVTGHRLLGPTE